MYFLALQTRLTSDALLRGKEKELYAEEKAAQNTVVLLERTVIDKQATQAWCEPP